MTEFLRTSWECSWLRRNSWLAQTVNLKVRRKGSLLLVVVQLGLWQLTCSSKLVIMWAKICDNFAILIQKVISSRLPFLRPVRGLEAVSRLTMVRAGTGTWAPWGSHQRRNIQSSTEYCEHNFCEMPWLTPWYLRSLNISVCHWQSSPTWATPGRAMSGSMVNITMLMMWDSLLRVRTSHRKVRGRWWKFTICLT